MRPKRLSVVHGPTNVGNLPWTLSQTMKAMGHDSRVVVNYDTWVHYPADLIVSAMGEQTPESERLRLRNGLRQPLGADVMHYYFGRTFLTWDDYIQPSSVRFSRNRHFPFADMYLARALGRRVVMTYQGCDARLAAQSHAMNSVTPCKQGACEAYAACVEKHDQRRRDVMARVDRLAHLVLYVNPELGHFLPRGSFLPYGNVDLATIRPGPVQLRARPLILHAPSDPHIKGTRQITEALGALRSEFDFDFRLIQGLSHQEAMAQYADADLLVDQLLTGWYGGLSVELMAMGKPVACYIRDADLGLVPEPMRRELPMLRIHPHTLVDDLRRILIQRAQWPEIGRQSRAFAMRWHDPVKIASVLLEAYRRPADYDQLLRAMPERADSQSAMAEAGESP
jgi:hypothetical protein